LTGGCAKEVGGAVIPRLTEGGGRTTAGKLLLAGGKEGWAVGGCAGLHKRKSYGTLVNQLS
jgi:hypothetical protein